MSEKQIVAVYAPGAVVGYKLSCCCNCSCHREFGVMHFVACCTPVEGFEAGFPQLDKDGTPLVKLPNCPNCGEDGLGIIHEDLVFCHRCRWALVRGSAVGATT